jgi:hypothetical protein
VRPLREARSAVSNSGICGSQESGSLEIAEDENVWGEDFERVRERLEKQ